MKKSNWQGGKGSQRRNSNEKAYADNWDKIFGKAKGCPVKHYVEDIKQQKLIDKPLDGEEIDKS